MIQERHIRRGDLDRKLDELKEQGLLREIDPEVWWERPGSLGKTVGALFLFLVIMLGEAADRALAVPSDEQVVSLPFWSVFFLLLYFVGPHMKRLVASLERLRDAGRKASDLASPYAPWQLALGWWLDGSRPLGLFLVLVPFAWVATSTIRQLMASPEVLPAGGVGEIALEMLFFFAGAGLVIWLTGRWLRWTRS